MSGQQLDVTSMMWQPALLRLTMIGNPDVEGGKPTPCFLTPQSITMIRRAIAAFPRRDDPAQRHPDAPCTEVFFCHGAVHVLESAEEVAMLRDRALGHEPPKPKRI